tara:strand:+ start:10419 stop:10589 length:171 start_codon:yes stop_codon:yes gene_type:complete
MKIFTFNQPNVIISSVKNDFSKYIFLVGFIALIIALISIFAVLSEINNFFTDKIKI